MQQKSKTKATILQALEENGYLSGYRIFQEVQKTFSLKPFQVYKALYEMEDENWIGGDWRTEEGRHRKLYKLTGKYKAKAGEAAEALTPLAGPQVKTKKYCIWPV